MAQKQIPTPEPVRPTKRQRELLSYIERFIAEHGYSPSYREIMAGLQYGSVATVALHVNSLIKRGHLVKRTYSARSLELTHPHEELAVSTNVVSPSEEKWLVKRVEHAFDDAEQAGIVDEQKLRELEVLIEALQVLGMQPAAQSFAPRLGKLRQRIPVPV